MRNIILYTIYFICHFICTKCLKTSNVNLNKNNDDSYREVYYNLTVTENFQSENITFLILNSVRSTEENSFSEENDTKAFDEEFNQDTPATEMKWGNDSDSNVNATGFNEMETSINDIKSHSNETVKRTKVDTFEEENQMYNVSKSDSNLDSNFEMYKQNLSMTDLLMSVPTLSYENYSKFERDFNFDGTENVTSSLYNNDQFSLSDVTVDEDDGEIEKKTDFINISKTTIDFVPSINDANNVTFSVVIETNIHSKSKLSNQTIDRIANGTKNFGNKSVTYPKCTCQYPITETIPPDKITTNQTNVSFHTDNSSRNNTKSITYKTIPVVSSVDDDSGDILRNMSEIIEEFRHQWPVDDWLRYGYFKEDYLTKIAPYWLSYPPPSHASHYILALLYTVIMTIGVGGNLLVIFMFLSCKSLKTPANILVMNLAVSDLLMLLKMPVFIVNSIHFGPVTGEMGCQLYGFFGGLTGIVSIATLAAIGLDRYYVIVHPLDPIRRTTRLRARLCVLFVWTYGFIFAVIPVTDLQWNRYVPEGYLTSCSFDYLNPDRTSRIFILVFFTAAWIVPFFVLLFSYLSICRVVIQAREVKPGSDSSRHCRENDKRRTELRLAEVVLGVVGLWFVSWTPYAIVALLGISGNQKYLTPLSSMIPALFCKLASTVDPFVYAVTHPRFRQELVKMWSRVKGKRLKLERRWTATNVPSIRDRQGPPCSSSTSSRNKDGNNIIVMVDYGSGKIMNYNNSFSDDGDFDDGNLEEVFTIPVHETGGKETDDVVGSKERQEQISGSVGNSSSSNSNKKSSSNSSKMSQNNTCGNNVDTKVTKVKKIDDNRTKKHKYPMKLLSKSPKQVNIVSKCDDSSPGFTLSMAQLGVMRPPSWFKSPKPYRNRSTSLRVKSKSIIIKDSNNLSEPTGHM